MSLVIEPSSGKTIAHLPDNKKLPGEFVAATSEGNHPSTKKSNKASKGNTRGRPRRYPPDSKLTRDSLRNVKQRCCNPNNRDYCRYTGRLYEPWHDLHKFYEDVVAEIGERPSRDRTLDRIDGGMYRPGNIRWATKREQARNRRGTKLVEVAGEMVSMAEAARITGVHRSTISRRHDESSEKLGDRRRRTRREDYSALVRRVGELEDLWKKTGDEAPADLARELQYLLAKQMVWWSGDESLREPTEAEIEQTFLPPTRAQRIVMFLEAFKDNPLELHSIVDDPRLELPPVKRWLAEYPDLKKWLVDGAPSRRAAEERKRKEQAAKTSAEKERKERERVRYLTISMSPEAKAWRRENGVSDDEANRRDAEIRREEEEAQRLERQQEICDEFDRLERALSKKSGTAFHLREMLRPFIDQLPGEFVSALYAEMWEEFGMCEEHEMWEEHASQNHHDRAETTESGDPRYPGFSCYEHYVDYRDAAIGFGEWPEEVEFDDC